MDPISLTVSVLALAGVAGSAAKLSYRLLGVAREASYAKDEIENFCVDVDAFASVIQTAHCCLEQHCIERTQRPSLVLETMEQNMVLQTLVKQSKIASNQIRQLRRQFKSLHNSFDLVTRIRWHWGKPKVASVKLGMESVKSSLSLVISCVSLEIRRQERRSPGNDRIIKILERQIRNQTVIMQQLQNRLLLNDLIDANHPDLAAQDVLMDLGQNLTSEAARFRRASSTSATPNRRRRGPQESSGRPSVASQAPLSPARRPPAVPLAIPEEVSAAQGENSMQIIQQSQRSSSNAISELPQPVRIAPNEGDFISVRPTTYLLELSPSHEIESIGGYVEDSHVTAILDRNFESNLISQAFAASIGLQVDPLEGDMVYINFGDDLPQEPSIGNVTVRWSDGRDPHGLSFTFHCHVCVHGIRQLVLGKPFLERREYYRRRLTLR